MKTNTKTPGDKRFKLIIRELNFSSRVWAKDKPSAMDVYCSIYPELAKKHGVEIIKINK